MNKKTCFVIMPFSKTQSCSEQEWTKIYEEMIKPAVTGSKLGFICERAKLGTGNFIKDILNNLNIADVVIADLTDMNPNVCYELGVRHTLRSRTILIAQAKIFIPSDLQSYWVVIYDNKLSGLSDFKRRIREILREMYKTPEKSDSPVADFLVNRNRSLLASEKSATSKKLIAFCSELSFNISVADHLLKDIQAIHESIQKKELSGVPIARFEDSCLDLLLSTQYIALSEQTLWQVRLVKTRMLTLNRRLDLMSQEKFYEPVTDKVSEFLPAVKEELTTLLKEISRLRVDFLNDNYQEPQVPATILADKSHKEYLLST